jgi:hypothetical protein
MMVIVVSSYTFLLVGIVSEVVTAFEAGDGVGFVVGVAVGTDANDDAGSDINGLVGIAVPVKGKQSDKYDEKRSNYSDDL